MTLRHVTLLVVVLAALFVVVKNAVDDTYNRPLQRLLWRLYLLVAVVTVCAMLWGVVNCTP